MRRTALMLWLALLAIFPTALLAQTAPTAEASGERPGPDWNITLGAGSIVGPRFGYMGSDEVQVLPLPYVDIRWRDRFFVSMVEGVGVNAIADRRLRAGAALYFDPGRQEDDGDRLRGLGNIDLTPEARAFVGYLWGPGASGRHGPATPERG